METHKIAESSSISAVPVSYHDKAEILAALHALSQKDRDRLVNFAFFRLLGAGVRAGYAAAEDLLTDAVLKTLLFERKWKRGVSFFNHLAGSMRSLEDNRSKKASRHVEVPADLPAPSTSPEIVIDAKETVKRLCEELRDDAIALKVLETMADRCSPAEAQKALHISYKVYRAAVRRIRRLAEALRDSSHKDTAHG